MRSITADYQERIVIAPDDVIPKSSWFKFVKCSLLLALSMLIVLAVITLIVAESFVIPKHKDTLAIGIVSLVGIILFLVGIVAITKEHIPLVLTFSVSMIIYLLVFMYSRVITSPGLIILRTFILLLLAVESFCFCIMIRDWRAIQISRINQKILKEAQLMQQYAVGNGLMMPPGSGYSGPLSPHSNPLMSPMYTGPASAAASQMYQSNQMQQQQSHLHQPYSQHHQKHITVTRMQQMPQHNRPPQHRQLTQQQQLQHQQQLGRQNQYNANLRAQQQSPSVLYRQQHPNNNIGQQRPLPAAMNPYIQVEDEDENPYSVIGEPVQGMQSRFYVPANRY